MIQGKIIKFMIGDKDITESVRGISLQINVIDKFTPAMQVFGERIKAFNEATIWAAKVNAAIAGSIHGSIHHARIEYKKQFGTLPCGKSQRTRMVKKRNKKIMEWFDKETS